MTSDDPLIAHGPPHQVPRIDHPALMMEGGIYQFAIEKGLPVQVHVSPLIPLDLP